MRRYPAPPALFPIAGEPAGPLDLIPIVADHSGRGARAWRILSRLPITEGEHAGKRIGENAPPWMPRLTKLIFGHVDEIGLRVLREVFAAVAKKNAKSSYAAALALTKLLLDEEERELVVCLAAKRQQARLVFDTMAAMISADEDLKPLFVIVDYRHVIKYPATNSQARAISAELASVVGGNPSLAVADELHLLGATPKGAKLLNQIRTGSVSRKEPLLVSISTAPVDRSEGIFESTMAKARRVIAGKEIDPRFFAWICEIPAHLDPEDPKNWHWSNPSLGFTVTLDRLRGGLESARSDPAALRDFRSQNLNIAPETSAGESKWIALAEWDGAADDTLTIEAVIEESRWLYAGIDAGGLDDLSALALLGKNADGEFLLWTCQWLSRQGYEKRKATNDYDAYIAAGELTLFDGGNADIAAIAEIATQAGETGKLGLIGIDSYGASELAEALGGCGAEVQAVPQSWKLTPCISWVERRIADHKLRHNGSSLLRWNVGNAIVTRAGNASVISKATTVGAGKIDGVAAVLNAVAACLARAAEDVPSIYDGPQRPDGFLVL